MVTIPTIPYHQSLLFSVASTWQEWRRASSAGGKGWEPDDAWERACERAGTLRAARLMVTLAPPPLGPRPPLALVYQVMRLVPAVHGGLRGERVRG